MKFQASRSEYGFYCFHYLDGTTRETNFTHISYYEDDYVLAKRSFSNYFFLLDLEGNQIRPNLVVVFRFDNGYLLTHEKWINERTSRDDVDLSTNSASYKVLDFSSGMSKKIIEFQDWDMFRPAENNPFNWKIIGEHFQRKVYFLDDFVFTDIFEDNFLIVGNLRYIKNFDINLQGHSLGQLFKKHHDDKIWTLHSLDKGKLVQNSNYWEVYNTLLKSLKSPKVSNPKVTTVEKINSATKLNYDRFIMMQQRADKR